MQVSLHSYSTSTGYHPTIKIVGFLARKFYKNEEIHYVTINLEGEAKTYW